MKHRRIHIMVAEPSIILRKGIVNVLLDMNSLRIDVAEVVDLIHIKEDVLRISPDIIIVNPANLGMSHPRDLVGQASHIKFVAFQNYVLSTEQTNMYDAVISVTDTLLQIESTLEKLVNTEEAESKAELSTREKEIVAAIALGKSNKEIAEQLFISTHTVMTHRKNIASKLEIHNPAGLTIYAIVNKLIDIDQVQ